MAATEKQTPILNCIIVDDENLAREGLSEYVEKVEFLNLVGMCSSAIEAADILKQEKVDLMFLDIQMPHLSGLDFLETLIKPPITIFTTAYSEYAIDGFRLKIIDYLLKPITFKRFFQACIKAQKVWLWLNQENVEKDESSVYIRQGDTFLKLEWMDILYVESMQNYLKIHLKNKTHTIHQTMMSIETLLPQSAFFRIHKSYLINIFHIDLITGNKLLIDRNELPISRQRKEDLLNTVVYKKLISK